MNLRLYASVAALVLSAAGLGVHGLEVAAEVDLSSSSSSTRFQEDEALYQQRVDAHDKTVKLLESVIANHSLLERYVQQRAKTDQKSFEQRLQLHDGEGRGLPPRRRTENLASDFGGSTPLSAFWELAEEQRREKGEVEGDLGYGRDFWDICNQVAGLGFGCEHHTVVTEDGFELDVVRIPPQQRSGGQGKANGYPVILQHGLIDTASCWVANYHAKQNLGTILSGLGYDVFMPNARGNSYSTKNRIYSAKSDEYWQRIDKDFMAKYDMPANIKYVLNVTNRKTLSFVGHSQGGMMGFAAFSYWRPELAKSVDYFFALAPACWVRDTSAVVVRLLASLSVAEWLQLLGAKSFLDNSLIEFVMAQICPIVGFACALLLDIFCGPSRQINTTQLATITRYTPGGTSVSNMIHWAQEVRENKWGTHDFGKKLNEKYWGSSSNPHYTPQNMTNGMKTVIFYGDKDALAHPKDVQKLLDRLPPSTVVEAKLMKNYAHLDFTWGANAHLDIYPTIIEHLGRVSGTAN